MSVVSITKTSPTSLRKSYSISIPHSIILSDVLLFKMLRNLHSSIRDSRTRLGRVLNHDRIALQPSNTSNNTNPTHVEIASLPSRRRSGIKEAFVFISLWRSGVHVNGRTFIKDKSEEDWDGRQGNRNRRTSRVKRFCSGRPTTEIHNAICTLDDTSWLWRS